MLPLVLTLAVVALLLAIGMTLYNGLVRLRQRVRGAFAQIDVQLRRRHDLIPSLVETAKGYLKHERETLEAVIAARSRAVSAERAASQNPGDPAAMGLMQQAEAAFSGAIGRLMAVAEAYPDLRADAQMKELHEELTSTENRIAFARQHYNDAVERYNVACEAVPSAWVAGPFGFRQAAMFEAPAETREAPAVSFS
jgi:LemA protein